MNLGGTNTQPSVVEALWSGGSLEWRHLPVYLLAVKNESTQVDSGIQVYPCTQWKPHLHALVLAQAVNDFDDEVLGNLEVLQADALRAVQHEEEVDGTAGALCIKAQDGGACVFLLSISLRAAHLEGRRTKASSCCLLLVLARWVPHPPPKHHVK